MVRAVIPMASHPARDPDSRVTAAARATSPATPARRPRVPNPRCATAATVTRMDMVMTALALPYVRLSKSWRNGGTRNAPTASHQSIQRPTHTTT
jgi:hypothetical protein